MPQLYVRTDFSSVLYSFILVFLLTLSPLIQIFCSFASAAEERRFVLLMSSSSPICVPTFFAFLYSLPDHDSVVCSVLSALTSKLYFFNVFCTSAISANSNPIKSASSAYTISVGRAFSKSEVGRGKMVLTSFRACSKCPCDVGCAAVWYKSTLAMRWIFFCAWSYSVKSDDG